MYKSVKMYEVMTLVWYIELNQIEMVKCQLYYIR